MTRPSGPKLSDLAGMGIVSALCIAAGVGVGYWIDESTRAGVPAVFAGLAVGLLAAGAASYSIIKRTF